MSSSLVKVVQSATQPRTSLLLLARAPVNAFNTALLVETTAAIQAVEKQHASEGWGLVIASEQHLTSSVFSAGLDLSEMYNKTDAQVATFWSALQEFWMTLYSTPLATVCALNGHAPAGGCLTALSCDYRVAAGDQPKALMGLNEAKFGLVAPQWFATSLQSVVGTRQAERMLQLGEMVSFDQAKQLGLVDELVPRQDVVSVAEKRASDWASNGPWESRHQTKLLLRQEAVDRLRGGLDRDTERFLSIVKNATVQDNLGKYMASLSKPKKAS